jgi:hypothetical protein
MRTPAAYRQPRQALKLRDLLPTRSQRMAVPFRGDQLRNSYTPGPTCLGKILAAPFGKPSVGPNVGPRIESSSKDLNYLDKLI